MNAYETTIQVACIIVMFVQMLRLYIKNCELEKLKEKLDCLDAWRDKAGVAAEAVIAENRKLREALRESTDLLDVIRDACFDSIDKVDAGDAS